MSNNWQNQKEATNAFWLKALYFCAFFFGRNLIRFALYFIAIFYCCFSTNARKYSALTYTKITGKKATWLNCYLNFLTFAQVSVDRLFFLSGKHHNIPVNIQTPDIFNEVKIGQGCILLVSHVGSFDVLRVLAEKNKLKPIHILMDTNHNPEAFKLIQHLNPMMASQIIDSNQSPATLALTLQNKIRQGHMIGIMADRIHHNEASVKVDFFEQKAAFPSSPWSLAAVLKIPVIVCIGLLNKKLAYDVYFHLLTKKIPSKRKERQQSIQLLVQSYANLLAYFLRDNPYNWFNFYDFWDDE